MAALQPGLEAVLKALPSFSQKERRKLLASLCQYPDLQEDLRDIFTILKRREEPSRPYEKFAQELRSQGRL